MIMSKTQKQAATATKIRRWIDTVKELKRGQHSVSVTRLTSIKNICKDDEIAAENFAIFIAKKIMQDMRKKGCPGYMPQEYWKLYKQIVVDGINLMENYLQNPTDRGKKGIRKMLKKIEVLHGKDRPYVPGTEVHFFPSLHLLDFDNALRCFVEENFSYWAYQSARKYVEYCSQITVESIPMLLEVAEFWCQYCFDKTLVEKFPELMSDVGGEANLRSPTISFFYPPRPRNE